MQGFTAALRENSEPLPGRAVLSACYRPSHYAHTRCGSTHLPAGSPNVASCLGTGGRCATRRWITSSSSASITSGIQRQGSHGPTPHPGPVILDRARLIGADGVLAECGDWTEARDPAAESWVRSSLRPGVLRDRRSAEGATGATAFPRPAGRDPAGRRSPSSRS